MIDIGKYNILRIAGKNKDGLSLSDGKHEVLLPFQEIPPGTEPGENIEAFVYVQKDGQLVATMRRPYAQVDEFAFLKVIDINDDGAFLDLGISKDVFVPKKEQKRPMELNESYVVYLYLDHLNRKIVGSSRLEKFIIEDDIDVDEGDEVQLLIVNRTDLGFNAIIDQRYMGLLYHNEVFSHPADGELRKGWIKKIRPGGKIDLTLQPSGYGHILDTKELILAELKAAKGLIALGDKSSPEDIYDHFQISKSAFKKAIGGLYKERLISLSDNEIRLL